MIRTPTLTLTDDTDTVTFTEKTSVFPWPEIVYKMRIEYRRKRDGSSGAGARVRVYRPNSIEDAEIPRFFVKWLPRADYLQLRTWLTGQDALTLTLHDGTEIACYIAELTPESLITRPAGDFVSATLKLDFEAP